MTGKLTKPARAAQERHVLGDVPKKAIHAAPMESGTYNLESFNMPPRRRSSATPIEKKTITISGFRPHWCLIQPSIHPSIIFQFSGMPRRM